MNNNCMVCNDKKKVSMKESELRRIVEQLTNIVRRSALKNKMEKPVTREEEMFYSRCQYYTTNIKTMCGQCPYVDKNSITVLDKKVFTQLLLIYRLINNTTHTGEKESIKRTTFNVLRGYYPELCRLISAK